MTQPIGPLHSRQPNAYQTGSDRWLSDRAALEIVAHESLFACTTAASLANGVPVPESIRLRLLRSVRVINAALHEAGL